MTAKLVIPEPNLWEAETPFTYGGEVRVQVKGSIVAELPIEIGLKQSGP
jgi:hypothetical protein